MSRPQPPLAITGVMTATKLVLPAVVLVVMLMSVGCVEHRTAVSPPVQAAPPPMGEPAAITQLIAGATVTNEPTKPITAASPLPIDLPVSVWRRDSDGTLSRGELRLTTDLPWWQRFPADVVSDLAPIDAEIFASGTPTLTPIPAADRTRLFDQAARDGFAHRDAAPGKSTP